MSKKSRIEELYENGIIDAEERDVLLRLAAMARDTERNAKSDLDALAKELGLEE